MFNIEIILQQLFYGLVLGSNYVLIAAGFSLIWGVVGVLNLSHGEFFMLGAYASYYVFKYVGGGFFRYVVDPGWQIPHFEKMLYDNAQLASLYLKAARIFKQCY